MAVVKALHDKETLEAVLGLMELSSEEQFLFVRQLSLVARYIFIIVKRRKCVD